jgi:hypothetical protein
MAPYIWLGSRWYAWLEFGPGGSHATFEQLAERLCAQFGGVRAESLPNPAQNGKEYQYRRFGSSELLLMRRDQWVALGAFYPDVPQVLRIGAALGATRCGWRWPLYDAWGWLVRCGIFPRSQVEPENEGKIDPLPQPPLKT